MRTKTCNSFVLLGFIAVLAVSVPGQGRGGGGGQHGPGPYRGGRDMQPYEDRDGDGIDDLFQARYQQRQFRRLADAHRAAMCQALAVPPGSDLKLLAKAGDIPGLPKDTRRELEAAATVAPPAQFALEGGRILTVYCTWSRHGGSLVRWYLVQSEGRTLRLEGKLLRAGIGKTESPPDYKPPDTIQWQPDTPTP